MARLIAYDHIIESAVALPGALAAPGDSNPVWRVTVEEFADAPAFAAQCVWRDAQLIWSINPMEQHAVSDRHLVVRRRDDADQRSVSENAIANGLPALGWIAGDVVIHAAAVVMPGCDRAIAIMAPSGGGKSTLLNELMQAGASLLADDTLVLRREDQQWIGSGLAGGWFMRAGGVSERAFIDAPAGRRLRRAAVGGFVNLALVTEAPEMVLRRDSGMASLGLLLGHRHRALVARAIGSEAANLATLARIAADMPVYTLSRQFGRICLTDAELAAMAELPNHKW